MIILVIEENCCYILLIGEINNYFLSNNICQPYFIPMYAMFNSYFRLNGNPTILGHFYTTIDFYFNSCSVILGQSYRPITIIDIS